jgi:hypothetical protein
MITTRSPSNELPIAEYLSSVSKRDLEGRYVVPKHDVRSRIESEIHRKTGCTPDLLSADFGAGRTKELKLVPIPADPKTFVQQTLSMIKRISADLTAEQATKFEIAFDNAAVEQNIWRDRIFIGARYLA